MPATAASGWRCGSRWSLLVLEILRRFFRSALAAGAGAFVFALHPVQTEAVGWVAGMKDLLAGFFSLAALSLYFAGNSKSEIRDPEQIQNFKFKISKFVCATIALILAMLSKPIAMMTPAIAVTMGLILRRGAVSPEEAERASAMRPLHGRLW